MIDGFRTQLSSLSRLTSCCHTEAFHVIILKFLLQPCLLSPNSCCLKSLRVQCQKHFYSVCFSYVTFQSQQILVHHQNFSRKTTTLACYGRLRWFWPQLMQIESFFRREFLRSNWFSFENSIKFQIQWKKKHFYEIFLHILSLMSMNKWKVINFPMF